MTTAIKIDLSSLKQTEQLPKITLPPRLVKGTSQGVQKPSDVKASTFEKLDLKTLLQESCQ